MKRRALESSRRLRTILKTSPRISPLQRFWLPLKKVGANTLDFFPVSDGVRKEHSGAWTWPPGAQSEELTSNIPLQNIIRPLEMLNEPSVL